MFALRTKTLVMFDRSIFHKNWKKINETPAKRAGMYVRKTAIRSIRKDRSKSKRPSKPGRPPKTRAAGEPMRRIYSVPYGRRGGVIVGAVKLSSKSRGEPVPSKLEYGGTVRVLELKKIKRYSTRPTTAKQRAAFRLLAQMSDPRVVAYFRQNRDETYEETDRRIAARPFMGPALERSLPKLPKMWEGTINKRSRKLPFRPYREH
jgi:hypothetical protein